MRVDAFRRGKLTRDPVVHEPQHRVLGEVTGDDGPTFDACVGECSCDSGPVDSGVGAEQKAESEPAAGPDFALKVEDVLARHGVEKVRRVGAADLDEPRQLLQLHSTDGRLELEWTDVVTRQNKLERLLEGIVGLTPRDAVHSGKIASPSVRTQA